MNLPAYLVYQKAVGLGLSFKLFYTVNINKCYFYIVLGERFDFILETNQAVSNYWLQGWPIGECGDSAAVYAIIRYEGADEVEPTTNKTAFSAKKVRRGNPLTQMTVTAPVETK